MVMPQNPIIGGSGWGNTLNNWLTAADGILNNFTASGQNLTTAASLSVGGNLTRRWNYRSVNASASANDGDYIAVTSTNLTITLPTPLAGASVTVSGTSQTTVAASSGTIFSPGWDNGAFGYGSWIMPTGVTWTLVANGTNWVNTSAHGDVARAEIISSTSTGLTNGSYTQLSFNTNVVVTNNAGLWAAGSPSQFTIPWGGRWEIGGSMEVYGATSALYHIGLEVRGNGAAIGNGQGALYYQSSGDWWAPHIPVQEVSLPASTVLTLWGFIDVAGAYTTQTANTGTNSMLRAKYLGP